MTPGTQGGVRSPRHLALAALAILAACGGNSVNDGPPEEVGSIGDPAVEQAADSTVAAPAEGDYPDTARSSDQAQTGDTLSSTPGYLRHPAFGVGVQTARGRGLHPVSVDFIRKHTPLLRLPVHWSDVEQERGKYEVPGEYDEIRTLARDAGTKLSVILAYNNPLYACSLGRFTVGVCIEGVASERNRDAFVRYVAFLVRELGSEVGMWEIWNEANARNFWRPAPNVDDYVALASATADTIRAIDSSAVIVSAGTAAVDFSFVEWLMDAGLHRELSAIGIHMNMSRPGYAKVWEDGERGERPLSEVLGRLEKLHARTGVVFAVTEFGFPLYSPSYRDDSLFADVSGTLPPERQEVLATTFSDVSASPAIHSILIFQLQDSRNWRAPLGATRGLVDGVGEPKPGMLSLAAVLDSAQ